MPGEKTESRGVMRRLARRLVRFYYPRLEISGVEKIPQSGPVLLCANHSNSMVDPVLIGVTARRPVRFMAKATLFDMPVVGRAMYALGMVPAYRGMDDASQVRRNLQSLDTGAEILVEGKALGIFPEGKTTDKARLDKVRSGAARMAIKAFDEGARGIQVVPLGINYERKEQFRSAVWVRVGDPIDIDEWVQRYDGDSRKAMRALTTEIADRLKQLMVHLDEPEWEPWLEDLEIMVPDVVDTAEVAAGSLRQRKRIADAMNHFLQVDRETAEGFAGEIENYRETVRSAGLKIGTPVLEQSGIPAALKVCALMLRLLVFSLPALLGTLWHLVPFLAVRSIARILDQPGLVTRATHRIGVGVPLYLAWYAALGWLMLDQDFLPSVVLSTLVFMPFAGVFALAFWRRAREATVVLWHQLLLSAQRKKLKEIRQLRTDLRGRLGGLAKEYAKVTPRPEPAPKMLWRRKASILTVVFSSVLLVAAAVSLVGYWVYAPKGIGERESTRRVKPLPPPLELAELLTTEKGKADLERDLEDDEKVLIDRIGDLNKLEEDATKVGKEKEFAEAGKQDWDWFQVQENSDRVQDLLRRFYIFREELFLIFWRYKKIGEAGIEPDKPPDPLLLHAFLVEYAAGTVLFETSLKFVHQFHTKNTVAKLNEGIPQWGIPPGFYNFIKKGLESSDNMGLFQEFQARYQVMQDSPKIQAELVKLASYEKLDEAIGAAEDTINKYAESSGLRVVRLAREDIKNKGKEVIYEAQKAISSWIGDFKTMTGVSLGQSSPGQFDELKKLLEPGDILLERRNYYGSNAFLPGYWPHGALYIGTAEDLGKLGVDEEDLQDHPGFGDDEERAKERANRSWKAYTELDHSGHECTIIEAVSEGVIFSSMEHSIGEADSVAVLRPILEKAEIKEAIKRAFTFWNLPYDFEFDFTSTDKLVCTEVVYRAYGGNSGTIKFDVENIMGRPTMPAVNLVRRFQKDRLAGQPQFEFIAFLELPDKQINFSLKALFVACTFCAFMMALLICHLGVKTLKRRLVFVVLLVVFSAPAVIFFPGEDGKTGEAVFKKPEELEETLKLKGLTWWNYLEKGLIK